MVVAEPAEPESRFVGSVGWGCWCLGGPVGDSGAVPGCDLIPLPGDGAFERVHLWWAGVVLEIVGELVDEPFGEVAVGDLVDRPDQLLGVPRHPYLTVGVTGW